MFQKKHKDPVIMVKHYFRKNKKWQPYLFAKEAVHAMRTYFRTVAT